MKKLILLIFATTSIFFNSYAQLNYINYHKDIIEAESLLIQNEMKSCLKKYRATFDTYPKTFARDAFLAFQIACMVEDTADISYFFEKSVANGIIWDPINHSEYYNNIILKSELYKARLQQLYTSARENYERSIDQKQRSYALGLLENDDKARPKSQDTDSTVKWLKVMDSNGQAIASLIRKAGYPGEHIAGVTIPEVFGTKKNVMGVQFYSIPGRIFFHNECTFQEVKQELLEAIKTGELTPKEYALMHEWSFHSLMKESRWYDPYYKFPCDRPSKKDKQYNFYLDPTSYSQDTIFVNKCREEIGMSSIEHEKKLIDFGKEHRLIVRFGFMGLF